MNLATLLLLTSTLVLRTGDRIQVVGPVQHNNGVVIFRVADGALYSVPESEVDTEATRAANESAEPQPQQLPKKLKVSPAERDRLLKELEQNHSGTPAPPPHYEDVAPKEEAPAAQDKKEDEARWRAAARERENAVREAKENLASLREQAERLRAEIRTLLSLGWGPDAMSYYAMQLENVEAQIPQAERELERAQREWDDFKEDARRQGILPGWLR